MNILKTIAAVSAIAVSSFSANAEYISVGGIQWNTDYVDGADPQYDDFFGYGAYAEILNKDTGALSGSGNITTVNGQNSKAFCAVENCILSYAFEGFVVTGDAFSGFSVDSTDATLEFTVTDSVNGSSTWLSLVADGAASYFGFGGLTEVTALWSVEEVGAWKNFDTDSQAGGADFTMLAGKSNSQNGTEFKADSVPAPTTLAIFGLGLLGLARLRKAK